MRFRLRRWVGFCWLAIVLFFAGETFLAIWTALAIYHRYYPFASFVTLVIVLALGIYRERLVYITVLKEAEEKQRMAMTDEGLIESFSIISDTLRALCQKRHLEMPLIMLSELDAPRTLVGMIDYPGRVDAVAIHPELPFRVRFDEMTGILSHELRHAKAKDNILGMISRVFMRAAFGFAIAGGLSAVMAGFWSPQITVFHAIGLMLKTVALVFAISVAGGCLRNLRSQFVEFKTDALACGDTEDPEALVAGLLSITELSFDEQPLMRKWSDSKWLWIFSTHPTLNARARAIHWVFRMGKMYR